MQAFAVLASLSFVAVAGVVGTRLLLLARRTRKTPELAIGLALILTVFLGYPLRFLPGVLGLDGGVARLVLGAGLVVTALGQCCIYVFTRAVFRPDAAWARHLVVASIAAILVLDVTSLVRLAHSPHPQELRIDGALLAAYVLYTLGYVWTAVEAFRYHALLRRRQVLGLADPVVANRFLLWAISGSSATVGLVVSVGIALLSDGAMMGHPVSLLVLGIAGVTASVTTYLAFMSPAAWARWMRSSPARA
jgi:hypothetical protein